MSECKYRKSLENLKISNQNRVEYCKESLEISLLQLLEKKELDQNYYLNYREVCFSFYRNYDSKEEIFKQEIFQRTVQRLPIN